MTPPQVIGDADPYSGKPQGFLLLQKGTAARGLAALRPARERPLSLLVKVILLHKKV